MMRKKEEVEDRRRRGGGGGGGGRGGEREREEEDRERSVFKQKFVLFVGCLTSQQHARCISGRDLLRQFYVLPH